MCRYKLRNHQIQFQTFVNNNNYIGALAHHEMGTGKTLTSLDFIRKHFGKLRKLGIPSPKALIIMPKSAHSTWIAECSKFTPDIYRNLVLIPYSQIHKAIQLPHYHNFQMIIKDESHYVKNPEAQRTENLSKLLLAIHNSKGGFKHGKIFLLSGTPMLNGAQEYYTSWAMCASHSLEEAAERLIDTNRYDKWKKTFAKRKENTWETRRGGKKQGATYEGIANADKLAQLLKPIVHHVRTDDCMDIPEAQMIPIDLKLQDDKLLADANIEEPEAYMALLERLGRAKTPYLLDWIRDFLQVSNEQLVCFSTYKFPLLEAQEKYKTKMRLITGAQSNVERAQILRDFQQKKFRVLGLTYGAGAEALNLQNCHTSVYHGYPWTWGKVSQAMARTRRGGQVHKTLHYFLTSGINDQKILHKVMAKKDAMDTIQEYMLDDNVKPDLGVFV